VKLPLSWLREWVDIDGNAPQLAARLTMLGFEVESIEPAAPEFSNVVVAEITAIAPHPQADKLRVCAVNDGSGMPLQIVCGAPNARAGLKTALARIGAVLPSDLNIKAAKLRGVDSAGMLCSEKELGLPVRNEGIMELPADAPVGRSLRDYRELDDQLLEINVTPNRGDAMSVLGIAREIAAANGRALHPPKPLARHGASVTATATTGAASAARPAVRLTPGAGAARFASRVIRGANNSAASPEWLSERLRRAGLRSVSPVVDVTNLVLLELGQPMHAYDLDRVQGDIIARCATAGEACRLLDGRDLQLSDDVLVIADSGGVVGMAGIMGGERTAIATTTTNLLLEVGWFAPSAIAGRARRYGLFTDACQRFERGVDPSLQERALARASELIVAIAGGEAGAVDMQELRDELPVRAPVRLRPERLARMLGVALDTTTITSKLSALGLAVKPDDAQLLVTPPSWRFDIQIEADLIEEVARTVGLDHIPEVGGQATRRLQALPEANLDERTILQLMAARGFQEVINFGFVDPVRQRALLGETASPKLQNPIASDLAVMRASLWPGLLANLQQNQRRQQARCKLFEIASVFLPQADGSCTETKRIAGLIWGSRAPEQWGTAKQPADFHDLKADVEALLAVAGKGRTTHFGVAATPPPALHPGRCAQIVCSGTAIGLIGELHPSLTRSLELDVAPILFELDWKPITTAVAAQYFVTSAFPQLRRDLSFTVDAAETFSRIAERVSVAASSRLKELKIFDVYSGKGVETGRKSIALGLILQDLSRTLTDIEADAIVAAVVTSLQSGLDARLRE
jgi:phenylalanyl-tRNA synthetase beta chain